VITGPERSHRLASTTHAMHAGSFPGLEVAAGQRMERVRHLDMSVPITLIGCS
jgi:hypothetical protein